MDNAPIVFDSNKMQQLASVCENFSKSELMPYSLRGKPNDILIIALMAIELDIPLLQSLNSINVIRGKPTIPPQLMIALVRRKLPEAIINFVIDEKEKVAICKTARNKDDYDSGLYYTATWDMTKAASMELIDKKGSPYKTQPMNMLKWRAASEACRVTFADILIGLYAETDFQDEKGEVIEPPKSDAQLLDEEQPIPPEDCIIGSGEYRIQYRKHAGKRLKELSIDEIEHRIIYFEKQIEKNGKLDSKDSEVHNAMVNYLQALEKDAAIEQGV